MVIFFYLLHYCVITNTTSVEYTKLLKIQQLWIVGPDFWLWMFWWLKKKKKKPDLFPTALLIVVSGRLSSSLACLPFLDWIRKTKRLIVIAHVSVFISRVTPLSGQASVHVVKAVYEQWPDMKPRLLWLCKQPHLFEPTCSPAFTSLINNEISLRLHKKYCRSNITPKGLHKCTIQFENYVFFLLVPAMLRTLVCSFLPFKKNKTIIYIAPCLFSFQPLEPCHPWKGELVQNDHYH